MNLDTLKGAVKSKTMWVGGVLVTLSQLAPLVPDWCAALGLDATTTKRVLAVTGILMLTLRVLTKDSLAGKASPDILPPPSGKP